MKTVIKLSLLTAALFVGQQASALETQDVQKGYAYCKDLAVQGAQKAWQVGTLGVEKVAQAVKAPAANVNFETLSDSATTFAIELKKAVGTYMCDAYKITGEALAPHRNTLIIGGILGSATVVGAIYWYKRMFSNSENKTK